MKVIDSFGASNILIVVSRWYGGTKLGNERFKHIMSTTRDILLAAGFSEPHPGKKKKKKK